MIGPKQMYPVRWEPVGGLSLIRMEGDIQVVRTIRLPLWKPVEWSETHPLDGLAELCEEIRRNPLPFPEEMRRKVLDDFHGT